MYQKLKTGNIPSDAFKVPVRFKQLLGVKSEQFSDMYDRSRYLFMLDAPFNVSNMCCKVMKKQPVHLFGAKTGKKPITAQMAQESKLRATQWMKNGCNAFDTANPISNPMSFWTEQDVLLYIRQNNLPICSVYGDIVTDDEEIGQMTIADMMDMEEFELGIPLLHTTGCSRTGCMFCGYGCHLEKSPNRFERMKETHPKIYEYIMKPWEDGGLGYKEIIDWINEHGNMNIRY